MLNFTAIDFETANSYRGSPCSVGLVKVRNGEIVDQRHWLIRPPENADWFDPFNVSIHGITPNMVAEAPRWRAVLPHIMDFIGDDVVIAHNASFDIGVIRYACAIDNIEWPNLDFLCTLVLARRAFSLPSYRLPFVTEACGFILEQHHDALADARAVVDVVRGMAILGSAPDVRALAAHHFVRVGRLESGAYSSSVSNMSGSVSLVAADASADADPDGHLYGRVVVFTGALTSMTRQLAWDEVARSGGTPELNTTKRTNVLVLGDFNPANLRPGATYSGKARKAFDLQDKGQDIELMTEADFLRVLDGRYLEIPDMKLLLDEPTDDQPLDMI
ncbi:exonuclease domain-containing protein [Aeromicrobium fastidiosum]|uniref:exonuclease domain-containing protein n=1 Tax=Aeromicrobium fastidiosum TaxID=52699 RepID=UPI002023711A|nr:exonuclease domain-containing protein [Aeromicrobium fastidiosum]MCL8251374.1 exonuclease domain-containing protein [Aeromicrobium fastidiosum]